jgi:hypothetical protein
MPPRVARLPSGRATVNQNHPAATAAAAARVVAAGKINGGKISAPTSRDSPSRAAKTLANEKISEICHHNLFFLPAFYPRLPLKKTLTNKIRVDLPAGRKKRFLL